MLQQIKEKELNHIKKQLQI